MNKLLGKVVSKDGTSNNLDNTRNSMHNPQNKNIPKFHFHIHNNSHCITMSAPGIHYTHVHLASLTLKYSHTLLGLPSHIFPPDFMSKILYEFLIPMRALHVTQLMTLIQYFNNIRRKNIDYEVTLCVNPSNFFICFPC
jgi:hypothetical protein